jgi:hypothetical protein
VQRRVLAQEEILQKLSSSLEWAEEKLRSKGLHHRTKDPDKIEIKRDQVKERLRHHSAKYDIESFDNSVHSILKLSPKSGELLKKFDYIETGGLPLTMANAMEFKIDNLRRIIEMLEEDQQLNSFFPIEKFRSKNVSFDSKTSTISYMYTDYPLKKDAKFLVDYLWGKRAKLLSSEEIVHKATPIKEETILYQVGISGKILKGVIDNFNEQCRNKNIPAKIRTKARKIWIEVIDQIPARK